jgi:hypothetical protein
VHLGRYILVPRDNLDGVGGGVAHGGHDAVGNRVEGALDHVLLGVGDTDDGRGTVLVTRVGELGASAGDTLNDTRQRRWLGHGRPPPMA